MTETPGPVLGWAAFERAVLTVVTGNVDDFGLRPEHRVEANQVPLVDPGPDVLPHPRGTEPLQAGHVRRRPAECSGMQVLERGVCTVEIVVVGCVEKQHVMLDVTHSLFGRCCDLIPLG